METGFPQPNRVHCHFTLVTITSWRGRCHGMLPCVSVWGIWPHMRKEVCVCAPNHKPLQGEGGEEQGAKG